MQPTKEEIKLASPCHNAIKAIAGEKECGKCKGSGQFITKFPLPLRRCPTCNGTGKLKYVWKPQVGEWVLFKDELCLISCINIWAIWTSQDVHSYNEDGTYAGSTVMAERMFKKDCVPLLPWETIERVLREHGIQLELLRKPNKSWLIWKHTCSLKTLEGYEKTFTVSSEWCNTRQEAVMLAVIELAKELKNDSKT